MESVTKSDSLKTDSLKSGVHLDNPDKLFARKFKAAYLSSSIEWAVFNRNLRSELESWIININREDKIVYAVKDLLEGAHDIHISSKHLPLTFLCIFRTLLKLSPFTLARFESSFDKDYQTTLREFIGKMELRVRGVDEEGEGKKSWNSEMGVDKTEIGD